MSHTLMGCSVPSRVEGGGRRSTPKRPLELAKQTNGVSVRSCQGYDVVASFKQPAMRSVQTARSVWARSVSHIVDVLLADPDNVFVCCFAGEKRFFHLSHDISIIIIYESSDGCNRTYSLCQHKLR